MTFGAMIGWLAVFQGADLWVGLLVAALAGALFGLLHAGLTVTLGLSQHVTGLGITLFASSFSYYIFRIAIPAQNTPPTVEPFQPLDIPVLSDLPLPRPTRVAPDAPSLRFSVWPYSIIWSQIPELQCPRQHFTR